MVYVKATSFDDADQASGFRSHRGGAVPVHIYGVAYLARGLCSAENRYGLILTQGKSWTLAAYLTVTK